MNLKGNPILIEMADQLPQSSKSFQLITTSVDYPRIVEQVKEDFLLDTEAGYERALGKLNQALQYPL